MGNKRIYFISIFYLVAYTVAHFPASVRDVIQQLLWVLQSPVPRALLVAGSGVHEKIAR